MLRGFLFLAILPLVLMSCGGDDQSTPSPSDSATPTNAGVADPDAPFADVSFEQAQSEATFPLRQPEILPDGMSLGNVRILRRTHLQPREIIIMLEYRGSSDDRSITITERLGLTDVVTGDATPGVINGEMVNVQGVVGAWVEGVNTPLFKKNNWLEWNKDGLNFTAQGPAGVGLEKQDYIDIANSLRSP